MRGESHNSRDFPFSPRPPAPSTIPYLSRVGSTRPLNCQALWPSDTGGIYSSSRYSSVVALRLRLIALSLILVCGIGESMTSATQADTSRDVVSIDISPVNRIATLRPLRAIGATVDKEPAGSIPWLYSKRNVRAMLDAGLGWLSYRLFTELSDQDWHWNPAAASARADRAIGQAAASTRHRPSPIPSAIVCRARATRPIKGTTRATLALTTAMCTRFGKATLT